MASEPWITWEKKEKQVLDFCCSIFSEEMMTMFLRSTTQWAALAGRAVPGRGSVQRPRCWMELFFGVIFLCSHQLNCVLLSAQPPNTAPALCSRSFGRSHPAETWGFLALRGSRNVCSTNSFGQLLQCWAVQQCHAGVRPRVPPAAPGHGIGDTASDVALEPGVASAPLPCFLWQLLQSLYFCQPFTPLGFQASQFSLLGK